MLTLEHPPLEEALEDIMPGDCFGCGVQNKDGHHIKSYWDGEKAVCIWTPESYHYAGGPYVWGGIVAGLLDCHMCITSRVAFYADENRVFGDQNGRNFYAVTANLNVNFRAPCPLGEPIECVATITSVDGKKAFLEGTVTTNGKLAADAKGLFIKQLRDGE